MLFARDVLPRNPGAPIIFDVKCSQRLGAADPRRRRQAADVEDRALADQGEDEGARRAARRRDERPHLLRRALVRLRRRHLHRGAAARDPEPGARSERDAQRLARGLQHPRAQRRLRRRRAGPGGRAAARRGQVPRRPGDRHDRRRAGRIQGRLRPDPRLEHDAGAGAALRGRDAGRAGADPVATAWRRCARVKPDAQVAAAAH